MTSPRAPEPAAAGATPASAASGDARATATSVAHATATSVAHATVVIVNWNGAHLLPACLDAVARLETSFRFETWVADNASTDGSTELLRSRYPSVRVIETGANLGFAGGNNAALRQVTTPFAVLLNNDATPEPGWLERLLAPFDEPGGDRLGAVTGKVVFLPRFVRLQLSTPGFVPGSHDSRELGVRISGVQVDGSEALGEVLWERLTYGAEGPGDARFFWTRPSGELLLPLPPGSDDAAPVEVRFTWTADRTKDVTLSWEGGSSTLTVGAETGKAMLTVPAGVPRVDVVNNAGGIVLEDGYGADRAYQQVDDGRFDVATEVFTACGNGMAMRRELGAELHWFDDDFFLYYEDTDLSWRIRARGYAIRYEPRAVLRHIHAASSGEWSPLFVFHVDRNRLLMVTKDATAGLALRVVGRYPLTTASMALRSVRQGLATRRCPAVRPTLLRLRVIASYLRLLPRMLTRRAEVGRTAAVRRPDLERRWLTPRAEAYAAVTSSVGDPELPEAAKVTDRPGVSEESAA
ncbi:MAG TPA: glycosyltransferase family 2 protein [Frankiaceae bacterium]|nr:glycosyltransferase family 2 protein [Frankiaceae bacterium]